MFSTVIKKSFAAAAAGSVWVATASTAFAEEQRKLSIYDEPEPSVVIIESPSKLEEQVYTAQKYANETLSEGKSRVDQLVKRYQDIENEVTTTVKDTIHEEEELFPQILYVGVAALGGTILARNRNILLRFLTSTTLAVGASYYLLPKTTHNVAVHLERLEKKYPQVVELHEQINTTVKDARKQVDDTVAQLRGAVNESTSTLREQIQQNIKEVGNIVKKD